LRTEVVYADDDGWSNWFTPDEMTRLVCCDCNLVHDVEITTRNYVSEEGLAISTPVIRLKRNDRSTNMRRKSARNKFLSNLRRKR